MSKGESSFKKVFKFCSVAYEKEKFILYMFILGMFLILALPFFQVPWLLGLPKTWFHVDKNPYHLWEIAAIIWSLFFLLGFISKLPDEFENSKAGARVVSQITRSFTFLIIFVSLLILFVLLEGSAYNLLGSWSPFVRAVAEACISALLCLVDWKLWKTFRNETDEEFRKKAQRFYRYFKTLDIPGLIGFVLIAIFLFVRILVCTSNGTDNTQMHLTFLSGASAVNLIIINVIFSTSEINRHMGKQ